MRSKIGMLLLVYVVVLLLLPFALQSPALQAGEVTPQAYLPFVIRDGTPIPPTPPPEEPSAPWIEETIITISSYQYDHPDCIVPTSPGDFVYPYPRINHDCVFQKPKIERPFQAVILHNSYVAITVLPELGGRLYRWQDKATGRQLLYENPVLRPTAWGWRGWWLATGGIEWAFPTDEHGLNEYRPWEYTLDTTDETVAITVSDVEDQTGMEGGVTITLDTDHNFMTLAPFVHNNTAASHDYQYWLNAMIALSGNHVSDQTEFIVPADQVQVHSRDAAANYLPAAGDWMDWPSHNGRNFQFYGDWEHYLGFFAPNVSAGFSGIYDHAVDQGIVRIFDSDTIPGTKFFGPANLGPELWTEDGSTYVEMWSSGVTADFWTYTSLAAGVSVSWRETWYPVNGMGGFDTANETAALRLTETGSGAEIGVSVTGITTGTVSLLVDGIPAADWPVTLAPGHPFTTTWERPSGMEGALSLQLLDEEGVVLAEVEE